jgi:hypothetical protein
MRGRESTGVGKAARPVSFQLPVPSSKSVVLEVALRAALNWKLKTGN